VLGTPHRAEKETMMKRPEPFKDWRALVRRAVPAVLMLALAAAGVVPLPVSSVQAGDDFCGGDPLVMFNGNSLVHFTNRIPNASRPFVAAANPVVTRIFVPSNVDVRVVATNGSLPERVEFVRTSEVPLLDSVVIRFQVFAPDSGSAPYPVLFTAMSPLQTAPGQGLSGRWNDGTVPVPLH
jgi:hypothetical protein